MKYDIVAPSVGESITEVSILKWNKQDGEQVESGEVLLEIESDKATVEIAAESAGALKIIKRDGETIPVGEIIAQIDDKAKGSKSTSAAAPVEALAATAAANPSPISSPSVVNKTLSPSVRKAVVEKGIDPSNISGTGKNGRITKGDVIQLSTSSASLIPINTPASAPTQQGDRRVPMSRLRKTIANRLLAAQQNAAILTTFNEVNMKPIMDIRKKYKDAFKTKHGVGLGFMSFFTRACVEALKLFPDVNAYVDDSDIIYHDHQDIGIAVGTEKGLVVPVLKNAHHMSFLDVEKTIIELATKARNAKLGIKEMTGGTFTITNGGVYGSLLSTPILNPPQSAILGMHSIQERPMVADGQIVALPMMYLALSYDHRVIDGKGAVSFLITVKDFLENPEKLNLDFINGL